MLKKSLSVLILFVVISIASILGLRNSSLTPPIVKSSKASISHFNQGGKTHTPQEENTKEEIKQKLVRIAVCPTFLDLANALDPKEFSIIETESTSESLKLLDIGSVDYVLAGRPPKPHEKDYQTEFISTKGYSFMGGYERVINKDALDREKICTDLESILIGIDLSLKKVNDIDECSQEDVIITSWVNTDYRRFQLIHIMNSDGARFILSRTPVLYCRSGCPLNIINKIKKAYEG